jgi:hypothetical protein
MKLELVAAKNSVFTMKATSDTTMTPKEPAPRESLSLDLDCKEVVNLDPNTTIEEPNFKRKASTFFEGVPTITEESGLWSARDGLGTKDGLRSSAKKRIRGRIKTGFRGSVPAGETGRGKGRISAKKRIRGRIKERMPGMLEDLTIKPKGFTRRIKSKRSKKRTKELGSRVERINFRGKIWKCSKFEESGSAQRRVSQTLVESPSEGIQDPMGVLGLFVRLIRGDLRSKGSVRLPQVS